MTAVEKVKLAESRILAMLKAENVDPYLECPFCDEKNEIGCIWLCCEPLSDMVDTVCNRFEMELNRQRFEQARYQAQKAAMN